MKESEQGPKGRDRQLCRTSTLPRTVSHHKGDDIGRTQALEIQAEAVGREPALKEWAHHVEVDARCSGRQSALDGQVTPESIKRDFDRTEDRILSLWRHDLDPLKIIKDRAHRFERSIRGMTCGPTITQEAVESASSQIGRDHALLQKTITQIGQHLHL